MQRYFATIINQNVILTKDDNFHLTRVMRAKKGDEIEVVDENKNLFIATITNPNPLEIKVINQIERDTELKNHITLLYVMAKGEKTDWVIQKATELGVHKIVLLESKRSVVRVEANKIESKVTRFIKIAKEASEQSKRLLIPEITILPNFKAISDISADIKLIADEEEANNPTPLYDILSNAKEKSFALLVGPEGGFDREEVVYAKSSGYRPISLGKRVLRSETAAIHMVGMIGSYLERV